MVPQEGTVRTIARQDSHDIQQKADVSGLPTLPSAAAWVSAAEEAIAKRFPPAAELAVSVRHMSGVDVETLSMAQLDVLEQLHHHQLTRVAESRLNLVRDQEAERYAEVNKLALEIAAL